MTLYIQDMGRWEYSSARWLRRVWIAEMVFRTTKERLYTLNKIIGAK